MEKIIEILKTPKFSHHVYGFESHGLRNLDIENHIPADRFEYVFSRHYDFLKIDDARAIKALQSEKTSKGSLFIISFTHINAAAQNTLLKIIEEPTPNTTFFFIFPNAKKLLPTILSRIELVPMNRFLGSHERKIDLAKFINMSLSQRFEHNKKITNKKDKNIEVLEKQDLQFFLDDLEIFYIKQKPSSQRNKILETILSSRGYISANSASIKMILDTLAIHL
ncbi:MAG: hypothetical protein ACPGTS_00085 [Minisyncoccia bacterium]